MSKILVLYQDWGNWLLNDYSRFEYWFKKMDGAYDEKNKYYILALSNSDNRFKKENNVEIELVKSSPLMQIFSLFKFRRKIKSIIKEFKPDYVYTPFIYLLSVVPKSKEYQVIGFLRDKTAEMVKGRRGFRRLLGNIFYLLDYLAFKRTDILLHNGKSLEEYAKGFGHNNEIIYCPRPIADLEEFSKANKEEIIKKYNLERGKIILTVARLTKEKNIELGIKALKLLPEKFVYLIVGEGEEKENLIKLAEKERVKNRTIFVGFVDHKEIWPYYKTADVFWLLSKTDFEGTPNVLQEALYAKVPCVVSNISAMRNIIEDNKNGLILQSWNPKELSKKIEFLLKNKILYENIQEKEFKKINEIIKQNFKVKELFK